MGKSGNSRRKEQRRTQDALNKVIQEEILKEEDANYLTSLERIYGRRGPPDNTGSVICMPPPKKERKVVDCLGRTHVVHDSLLIPETLRQYMPKSVTQNGVTRIVANPEPKGKRKVELLRDHTLTYPDLFFSIFVAGDWDVREDEARFARMFARAGCKRAKSPLEADLIVFGGGSDVSPYLYGEEPHASTFANEKRDEQDMDLYLLALEHGIPMLGVCRGMQFLHVMNGGKLYQDVDKHVGEHPIYDLRNRSFIDKVSSVHHQMCRPNPDMMIIATNNYARNRWCNPKERHIGPRADIEAFYYPETVCIGVQGHPEYDGVPYFTKWVIELIEELVVMNPDIDWIDGNRRIKPDLLALRPKKAKASVVGYPTDGCNSELIAAMKMVRD